MIFCIQVNKPVGNAISKKDEQRYGWRIKQEAFIKITLYQRNNGTLKSTSRAIYPGEIFEWAGQQMFLQPFDK